MICTVCRNERLIRYEGTYIWCPKCCCSKEGFWRTDRMNEAVRSKAAKLKGAKRGKDW